MISGDHVCVPECGVVIQSLKLAVQSLSRPALTSLDSPLARFFVTIHEITIDRQTNMKWQNLIHMQIKLEPVHINLRDRRSPSASSIYPSVARTFV